MPVITSLVSYWPCDEASGNLVDVHNTNTLTEMSGTIGAVSGKVSGARDFEAGDTELFTIADNLWLSPGDTDFSFAVWAQLESLASGTIIGKYNTSGNNREYLLWYNNTSARFEFVVTSTGASSPSVTVQANNFGAPSTGTWYFIVAGHDSVNNQLFICVNDGTVNTTATSAGVYNGTGALQIGANEGGTFWDGLLDEIGFWAKRLSSAEITWLYNSGAGRSYADLLAEAGAPAIVGFWQNRTPGSGTTVVSGVMAAEAGDTLLAWVSWADGAAATVSSISDGVNTYTAATSKIVNAGGDGVCGQWFIADNVAEGNPEITVTISASVEGPGIAVWRLRGTAASALDATATATGSATALTSGTFTTTQASEVILTGARNRWGNTYMAGAGYTLENGALHCGSAYKHVTSIQSSVTATLTQSGANQWVMGVVTIKALVAASGGHVGMRRCALTHGISRPSYGLEGVMVA